MLKKFICLKPFTVSDKHLVLPDDILYGEECVLLTQPVIPQAIHLYKPELRQSIGYKDMSKMEGFIKEVSETTDSNHE